MVGADGLRMVEQFRVLHEGRNARKHVHVERRLASRTLGERPRPGPHLDQRFARRGIAHDFGFRIVMGRIEVEELVCRVAIKLMSGSNVRAEIGRRS